MILLAATFEFIEHFTVYYMFIFTLSLFVLYSTLNIILTIGAEELKDVRDLHRAMKAVFLCFSILTVLVLVSSLFDHDFSAQCDPYTYPPSLNMAKFLSAAFTLMSIVIYFRTVRCKKEVLKVQHESESEET